MLAQSPLMKYSELLTGLGRSQGTPEQQSYLEWLATTPKVTTIRINSLKTTVEDARTHLENAIRSANYSSTIKIELLVEIPDVILIRNGCDISSAPVLDVTRKEVVVDSACGAAVLRGAHIYAPGVMNMLAGTKLNELVNVIADAAGACKKGANKPYVSEHNVFIGIGAVRMLRYQLFNTEVKPSGIAIEMLETVSNVPPLGDIYASFGDGILQNLPSIICSRVLQPQPGDVVLDLCAAPGNKTTHLAELMQDHGCLIALDKSVNRIKLLRANVDGHGSKVIKCFAFDGVKAIEAQESSQRNVADGPPFHRSTFDKILLDAPCSGMGNRPILASSMSPKEQASYPILQKKLFATAVALLKPGGTLVYSTCTIFASENEHIVRWALDKFGSDLELIMAEPIHGGAGWPDVGLTNEQRLKVQRFGPASSFDCLRATANELFDDTVGFFIAKFIRK